MKLHILENADAVSAETARHIADRLAVGRVRVIGLATGRSPVAVYGHLADRVAAGRLSLADVTSFNLDEYLGVPATDPASFHSFMERHLLSRVTLLAHHIPDGMADDPATEAGIYEERIAAAGGIDLQLLGIGSNGHIAFNEPGSDLTSRTRVVRLTDSTRSANASEFGGVDNVPKLALTMGIGTIMDAREIVLIATGPAKAAALGAAMGGPVTPDCPASALQRHPNVHVFADQAAAELL